MKVLLINGSRRDAGCTYTALSEAAKAIESEGVETEIINVGSRVLKGEVDEAVKEAGEKVKEADGVIVGSPVYYASASGEIMMFLDRFFGAFGADMRYKPGSAVASARRGGTTSTIDDLNKYFRLTRCQLYLLTTGILFMEIHLKRLLRMKKVCRLCDF